ncbi:MAG: hypothetical protein AABW47_02160 [Nanoarchaeota archaeon]
MITLEPLTPKQKAKYERLLKIAVSEEPLSPSQRERFLDRFASENYLSLRKYAERTNRQY